MHKYYARPVCWEEERVAYQLSELALALLSGSPFPVVTDVRQGRTEPLSVTVRIFANGRWMWRKTVDTDWKPIIPICWKLPVAVWEQFLKWFNSKCIIQKNLRFKKENWEMKCNILIDGNGNNWFTAVCGWEIAHSPFLCFVSYQWFLQFLNGRKKYHHHNNTTMTLKTYIKYICQCLIKFYWKLVTTVCVCTVFTPFVSQWSWVPASGHCMTLSHHLATGLDVTVKVIILKNI